MKTLAEELWAVVKEYTRQVVELFRAVDYHWIGMRDGTWIADVLELDSYLYLSWTDVQVLIDRMEDWVAAYGSKEAVAQEVRDWQEWWLDPSGTESTEKTEGTEGHSEIGATNWLGAVEIYEERRHRYLRTLPKINLEHWLMGCPRDVPKNPSVDDELRVLVAQRALLEELADRYRDTRSLWNVIGNLDAEIKEKMKAKEKQDAKLLEAMKQSEAYKELRELQDRAIEEAF